MILQALQKIWLVVTVVCLVAAIPYTIWIGVAAWRKQWRKALYRAGVPFCAYLVLSFIVGFASYRYYSTIHHRVFGSKFDLGKPLFEYNSERAFNGDGYSFAVYELPAVVRKRFEHPDDKLLSKLPERSTERLHWSVEPWRPAPLDPRFNKQVDFALSSYDQQNSPQLIVHFKAIETALASHTAYYSFFHYSHGDYIGDIDFFLVDLAGGKLYIINHNT